ncbi:hypothetical protein NBO_2g0014 [Nosema bombycis CQ1]|uniref:Uncharacterized protein n=1 Tax=Nosema bombycis (strain CQ1 / CVCC 102059) TaxID=578461 RepID=R0KZ91_NOSB1|nr:hypothetical protein NBO_2g0014 [Nosema bombycis CQ1]|eukprot:EOB15522.1 hypothetical protein NBO_2g0014 [Nosema bombycis CQ1]
MFFVKKPFNLEFDKDNSSYSKKFTVTTRNGKSNTKLVVYEDGSVYLKNGSQYFKMAEKEIKKNLKICREGEEGICVVEDMNKKWFMHRE